MEPKIRFKGFEVEWKALPITEIASLKAGKSFNKLDAVDIPTVGYYPCYGGNGQRGYLPYYNQNGKYNIIGRQGALCGCINVAEGKFYATEHAVIVTPITVTDFEFLHESLVRANINQYATGAAQPGISVTNVNSQLSLNYPLYKEQKAIGKYFTSLDSQISASTSRLASLKQMKAASLQAMFPQEGETVPKVRFKGFEGEWKKVKFSDLAERISTTEQSGILPGVEYEDIISGEGRLNKDVYQKECYKYGIVFNTGDILFGKLRPYLKNILLADFHGVAVGDFWVLRSNESNSNFLYTLVNSNSFMEVANISSGSKMPRADWNLVSATFFAVPSDEEEQKLIGNYFTSLDRQITLQTQRLEKLKQIKSACLDKMFV